MLCQYKDILGKPKEGVHQYRIFNIAIVDLSLTVLVAFLIALYFKLNLFKSSILLIMIFGLGILMHYLFCVKTTLNNLLFN